MTVAKSLGDIDSTLVVGHGSGASAEVTSIRSNNGQHRAGKVSHNLAGSKKSFEFRAGHNQQMVESFISSEFLLDRSGNDPIRARRTHCQSALAAMELIPDDVIESLILGVSVGILSEDRKSGLLTEICFDGEKPLSRKIFSRYLNTAKHIPTSCPDGSGRLDRAVALLEKWNETAKNDEIVQLISNLKAPSSSNPLTHFEFVDLCISKVAGASIAKVEELVRTEKSKAPYIAIICAAYQTKEQFEAKEMPAPYAVTPDWSKHIGLLRVVFEKPPGGRENNFPIPGHLHLGKGDLNFLTDVVKTYLFTNRPRLQLMVTDGEQLRFNRNSHEETEGGFRWVKRAGQNVLTAFKADGSVAGEGIIVSKMKGELKLTDWVPHDVNLNRNHMIELSGDMILKIAKKSR